MPRPWLIRAYSKFIILGLTFGLMSCSTKTYHPIDAQPVSCRAKAGFSVETPSQRMRGSLQYVVRKDKDINALKLMILNPLGLTEALVELDSNGTNRLIAEGKERPIKDSPLFNRWISDSSFEELWFISGRYSDVDEKYILQGTGNSKIYQKENRLIRCENFMSSDQGPLERSIRRCHLKDKDFELWINFTSLSC